ncbi:MAG: casein kinase 1 family protein [archaeon]|nr:casein kinase 1 family protein [archaeon]
MAGLLIHNKIHASESIGPLQGSGSKIGTTSSAPSTDIRLGKRHEYRLGCKLGSGSFGDVYHGIHIKTNKEVAIKLESKTGPRGQQLEREAQLLKKLQRGPGLPRLRWFGSEGDTNVLVMDLLGPNMEHLLKYCGGRFSTPTIIMVADQLLTTLEYVHSKGIIHRDIKPANIVCGFGAHAHTVYLIDFGLSKAYLERDKSHIPYREGKPFIGTARYASTYTHLGIEQSRRDDVESLIFCLLYFFHGSLPWQGLRAKTRKQKYNRISARKLKLSTKELCLGCPPEFEQAVNYTRSLQFSDTPNYSYLRQLFRDLSQKRKIALGAPFDWTLKSDRAGAAADNDPSRPPHRLADAAIPDVTSIGSTASPPLPSNPQTPFSTPFSTPFHPQHNFSSAAGLSYETPRSISLRDLGHGPHHFELGPSPAQSNLEVLHTKSTPELESAEPLHLEQSHPPQLQQSLDQPSSKSPLPPPPGLHHLSYRCAVFPPNYPPLNPQERQQRQESMQQSLKQQLQQQFPPQKTATTTVLSPPSPTTQRRSSFQMLSSVLPPPSSQPAVPFLKLLMQTQRFMLHDSPSQEVNYHESSSAASPSVDISSVRFGAEANWAVARQKTEQREREERKHRRERLEKRDRKKKSRSRLPTPRQTAAMLPPLPPSFGGAAAAEEVPDISPPPPHSSTRIARKLSDSNQPHPGFPDLNRRSKSLGHCDEKPFDLSGTDHISSHLPLPPPPLLPHPPVGSSEHRPFLSLSDEQLDATSSSHHHHHHHHYFHHHRSGSSTEPAAGQGSIDEPLAQEHAQAPLFSDLATAQLLYNQLHASLVNLTQQVLTLQRDNQNLRSIEQQHAALLQDNHRLKQEAAIWLSKWQDIRNVTRTSLPRHSPSVSASSISTPSISIPVPSSVLTSGPISARNYPSAAAAAASRQIHDAILSRVTFFESSVPAKS